MYTGTIPLAAGGDYSISFPVLRAIGADRPFGLIHIYPHTDTWNAFQRPKFYHGAPFRRAVGARVIDPKRTIQIRIRGAQNSPMVGATPGRPACGFCSCMTPRKLVQTRSSRRPTTWSERGRSTHLLI
ncbi:arginase family protein [Alphaproteobacteria bacterium]|nr:arginase family protein [Alphaproteobacteria bacterium]